MDRWNWESPALDREYVSWHEEARRECRREILQIHTRGMPFEHDVDLPEVAEATRGFTGSDIAALAREAALATLRRLMPTLGLEPIATVATEPLEGGTSQRRNFHIVDPTAVKTIR